MNQVINNILTRRSIRDFSDRKVAKEEVETLLQAAIYAPSGMNMQTWKFTALMNGELIEELAAAVAKAWDREGYNFYQAPCLIIGSNVKGSKWGRDDNACAMQNIFLAAHSLEIGSVWMNQLAGYSDEPEIRAILTRLGVPENHEVFGVAALGYSMSEAKGMVEKKGEYVIIE